MTKFDAAKAFLFPITKEIRKLLVSLVIMIGLIVYCIYAVTIKYPAEREALDKKFIKHSKITTGEIISFREAGQNNSDTYMEIEFLHKERLIVGENRYSTNYMARNMLKWRHRKVLIAYDSLKPKDVSMILTKEQFDTYHLEMPDSMKNIDQLH